MKRFRLIRHVDISGISGTGPVAEGVQFTDGQCVMHWLTHVSSLGVYRDMDNLVHIHGHGGATAVEWLDD